jgi:hypothetical protein
MDEYMLENADAQNWHDYNNIAQERGWLSEWADFSLTFLL